jgi:NAD(P)-dependent dehydrogenase (short-subunit alcohol dehydrogenase family)
MRRVVITAGASGIGRAMAEAFLKEGWAVAICDIDERAITAFAEAHPDALALRADVAKEAEIEAFFDAVERAWGDGPDVLCANAGTSGQTGGIETLDLEQWRACIGVNLDGAFLAIRRAVRTMKAKGAGLILITSSSAGLMGYPFRTPYAAAKWALIGLMKSLAIELGPAGIRVNALCPGSVAGKRMEQIIQKEAEIRGIGLDEARRLYVEGVSLRTWIEAEEIAAMALYLASSAGRHISGQAIAIDGHTETLSP